MRPRHTIVAAIAVAIGLACAGTASASFAAFADGNDRPGRLDIKQVTEDHGAGGRLVHTITTFGRWPTKLLGPRTPNFFVLDISTDADRRPERIVFIYSANGHMIAAVFNARGKSVGSARASRPDAKSVKVSFLPSRIANKPGYKWLAASFYEGRGCSGGCADYAPNHGRILHDIRAPFINFPDPPDPAAMDINYELTFTVTDAGGSRLAFSQLEQRNPGETVWTPIWNSTTDPPLPFVFTADMLGDTDEFRVVAEDNHGNRAETGVVSVTTSP